MAAFILGCPLLTLAQKADCLTDAALTAISKHNSDRALFNDVTLAGFTPAGLQLLEGTLPEETM